MITLCAIARKAIDVVPAVIVRMAKPLTSGSCEKRQISQDDEQHGDAERPALAPGQPREGGSTVPAAS